MKPLKILLLSVYVSIFALGVINEKALADDDLYLCGIIKKVYTQERKVLIEVISEGCTGEKLFKLSQAMQLNQLVDGEQKCFMIDSNTCPQNQVPLFLESNLIFYACYA